MKSLELVIVQLEEVKRLIVIDRVPQLRLAHILLDSAVELIMHRMVRSELNDERYPFEQLENLRRIATGTDALIRRERERLGADRIQAEIKKLEGSVTSNTKRRRINREFNIKIDYLIERNKLPAGLGPVLKKLHEYRNETYHRDEHRIEVLRPAVLIYFDAACTVLEQYEPGAMILSDSLGPELTQFQQGLPRSSGVFELPRQAAQQLRIEVGLDLESVRSALREHLLGRLTDLQELLDYIEESATARNVIPGDAIRMLQIDDDDWEAILKVEVMRSRPVPYSMDDLTSWLARATALEDMTEKHALFTEFAAIEDCFEDIEKRAREAVWKIDERANMR
ncbi:hypothetical protein GCM10010402_08330 [Actinomadura luteofluorescens]|uniref:hypothetical protein n=1 Tax=Actinomadura luteofluorescens TaxID=46163 RepID=UPI0021640ADE|nr:hypothetical protein [Actinomadura glauciflava]MCR3738387.1 hypothetical protein [Actinomadura glauciflava]